MISLVGPQNRVAYVSYPSTVANSRSASLSVSPSPNFWNLCATAPHKEQNRHFTDAEVSFMGTHADRAQRFGVELISFFFNALVYSRLTLSQDLDDLLRSLSYIDENGQQKHLTGFSQFHPTRDLQEIERLLGYWKWHVHTTFRYLIHITKGQLRAHHSSSALVISPALFGHCQSQAAGQPEDRPDETPAVVEAVLGFSRIQTKVDCFLSRFWSVLKPLQAMWTVRFEGGVEGTIHEKDPA